MRLTRLVVLLLAASSCRTAFALKKYSATSVVRRQLEGHTVAVLPFVDQRTESVGPSPVLPDPPGFSLTKLTPEELEQWEAECDRLDATVRRTELAKVGQRFDRGSKSTFEVYSTTRPAPWLTDVAITELRAQGVALVRPADAEVVLSAVVRHAWLRVSDNMHADLVLDVTFTRRGEPPRLVRFHTRGVRDIEVAAVHLELLHVFMAAEQKLGQALVDELVYELERPVTAQTGL
ncbi:MAG: hypothetical protein JNK82_28665 [Myxococcaceae bacterium]|nr:hypothetical protein [Myxococcaceae bacterium]